jgi:hypothetical protein
MRNQDVAPRTRARKCDFPHNSATTENRGLAVDNAKKPLPQKSRLRRTARQSTQPELPQKSLAARFERLMRRRLPFRATSDGPGPLRLTVSTGCRTHVFPYSRTSATKSPGRTR